jgi:hypothetical protein
MNRQAISEAKNGTPDLTAEIACLFIIASVLFFTIYACAPAQGIPQLIKLGLNFVACGCQIVTLSYFVLRGNTDTNTGGLP